MESLDDTLAALLAGGRPAGTVTRGLLIGLRAALTEVAPDDPAVAALDRLLAGSPPHRLLAGSPPAAAGPAPGAPLPTGTQTAAPASPASRGLETTLAPLWARAAAAADEREPGDPPDVPASMWEELHLLSLRLAPEDRREVQAHAADDVRGAGAIPGTTAQVTVLGPGHEVLIPQLLTGGHALHRGLATAPDAPLPIELMPYTSKLGGPGADPATVAFVRLAVPVLHLVSLDRHLQHCLQTLQFRGFAPLNAPAEQDRFRGQLLARITALIDAAPGTSHWLECMVRLHEAVSSVVHLPPATDVSWWGRLRMHAHTILRDAAAQLGPGLVKLPPNRFAAARALTAHDIPLKLPDSSGMVLACVRVWSKIDDTENPGRVIYGS
ncbi:hypothetical protein AB0K00_27380 [Dactylosporangium sp. NPDC049525]|uniref:hypothetical protein n=1 Tax=Dactylosporangium sp. NPDC049525 TaxID=3154730 RepID=UPI00343F085A